MQYVIGVDIGGTNTKIIVMDASERILQRNSVPTVIGSPSKSLLCIADAVEYSIKQLNMTRQVSGIGIGVPGPTNNKLGIAYYVPNLNWHDVDIRTFFKQRFNCPVSVENDGNINLLGEWHFGAGKGFTDLILITLGTGLGGGILVNGSLLHGASSLAGEIGHMVIEPSQETCSCGNTGCWESFCSGRAMLRNARTVLPQYEHSLLLGYANNNLDQLTPKMILTGYRNNDLCSKVIVEKFVHYLSIGIVNLIHIFNPQKIILGGGISQASDIFLEPLNHEVLKRLMDSKMQCAIDCGDLLENAGAMGACYLALSTL